MFDLLGVSQGTVVVLLVHNRSKLLSLEKERKRTDEKKEHRLLAHQFHGFTKLVTVIRRDGRAV
jgi:hypothetical protein